MASLESAVAYVIDSYPHKSELSNARVTKILYLADWFALINKLPRVTNINWYFDNYGPFVWDIKNTVDQSSILSSKSTHNQYGQPKEQFFLVDEEYIPNISETDKKCIDHVIDATKSMYWDAFIKLVYSTHPVASSPKYTFLNLEQKAMEYVATQG